MPYRDWGENAYVFLPVFFDKHLLDLGYIIPTVVVYVSLCFATSGIRLFDNVYDLDTDESHSKKCKIPIIFGYVRKLIGYVLVLLCFFISFAIIEIGDISQIARRGVMGITLLYIVLNIAYRIKLKQIAIIDVFVTSVCSVLQILLGGFATGIQLTHWIILMFFLLSLFMAIAKCRDEVVFYEKMVIKTKDNKPCYNAAFLNQAMGLVAIIMMVCYIMYTVSPEVIERFQCSYLYVTSIFVFACILRYLQLIFVDSKQGNPTRVLLKDNYVRACIVGWIGVFSYIIYF